MPNWTEAINISHLHRLYEKGDINIPDLGRAVAKRLQNTHFYHVAEPELIDVIFELESLDEYSEEKDYDTALDMLVKFGDKNNNLWIETVKPSGSQEDEEIIVHKPTRMVDVKEENAQVLYGPYYNRETTVTRSSSGSSTKGRVKTIRNLSREEFDKRLTAKDIKPDSIPTEMYNYMKDASDDYQAWLMECLPNLKVAEIRPYEGN